MTKFKHTQKKKNSKDILYIAMFMLLYQKRQNYDTESEEEKMAFIPSCLEQLFESQSLK